MKRFYICFPCCSSARARGAQGAGGQPPAPGLQAPGGRARGGAVRGQKPHGLLRGQPALRLQHPRELLRAVAHGPAPERHGEAMAE